MTFTFPILSWRVIDGDTVDCLLDLGCDVRLQMAVRLLGINAPEIHGAERPAGLVAAAIVQKWLTESQNLTCESVAWDKYGGRLDGSILSNETFDLSAHLLSRGVAKGYDDTGPKPTFTPEEVAAIAAMTP